ncbi:MAG: hypothetical protein PWP08_865 [Methanofollis sp.]|nr:hypothetical protein [Methanofollis sp.]
MREYHAKQTGADQGEIGNGEKKLSGSPRDHLCTSTGSGETAAAPSAREEINTVDPVPLYLVPHALAVEIRRLGGAIAEVRIRRTGQHRYAIAVVVRG